MPRESSFVEHVLDLLSPLGPSRARPMMGAAMIYCRELPVAIVVDDQLFLKTDGQTKGAFADAGCEPFFYESRGRTVEMSFWSAPDGALEDPEAMRPWGTLALEAATRSRRPPKRRTGNTRSPPPRRPKPAAAHAPAHKSPRRKR